MTLIHAFTWLATALALVGFAIITVAQFQTNTWVRINTEWRGFKWIAAAAFIAMLAVTMSSATQVFG